MKHLLFGLFLAGAVALSGCSGTTGLTIATGAGAVADVTLSSADLASLQKSCAAVQAPLAAATAPTAPTTLASVASYPVAFCKQILAGNVANANGSSVSWFSGVLGVVQTVAQDVGMVLPLLALL